MKIYQVEVRSELFDCFDVSADNELEAEDKAIDEMQRRIELGHIDFSVIDHTVENVEEVENKED